MHKNFERAQPRNSIQAIAKKMRDLGIGAIPIVENVRLIGMMTDHDIPVCAVTSGRKATKLTARDVISKGIVHRHDHEKLADTVRMMQQKKIRRLPTINEGKRMVSLLSLDGMSHSATRQITDEVAGAVLAHS